MAISPIPTPSLDGSVPRARDLDLLAARDRERQRIAQDVHDVVGQALIAVRLSLLRLRRQAAAPALVADIGTAVRAVDAALADIRQFAADLRPSPLAAFGLVAAIREHAEHQARRAGLVLDFEARAVPASIDAEVETACFRIAQEAITNVICHARATRLRVAVRRRWTELELLIQDDGLGLDASARRNGRARQHLGLVGMHDRAESVGGSIRVASTADGTSVIAQMPLNRAGRSA